MGVKQLRGVWLENVKQTKQNLAAKQTTRLPDTHLPHPCFENTSAKLFTLRTLSGRLLAIYISN